MSIISEVKCARCDRKYSGVRSRCPYCGARRIGRGKYSEESDNAKGKMLIGVMIMSVLVVAAGVLLFTAPRPNEVVPDQETQNPGSSIFQADDENTALPGLISVDPSPAVEDDHIEEIPALAAPTVQSVTITYANREKKDFTATVGERVVLRVKIQPLGVEEEVFWKSSNRQVFDVVASNTDGTQATVTGTGKGTATLTVTVGGIEEDCVVRIK